MKTLYITNRKVWRSWLAKYHKKEDKAAVVVHKRHTGKSAPTHRELIEDAICFGWIDTTIKRLDEDRFMRRFSKRKKNSKWSDNTLMYAKQLIQEGKMTDEGMKFYKLGLQRPTHDEGIAKNPTMPLALKRALSKSKKVNNNFEKFPPSTKKIFYRSMLNAKLPQTREKRIQKIVAAAREGNKNIF